MTVFVNAYIIIVKSDRSAWKLVNSDRSGQERFQGCEAKPSWRK